jgi:hypothetical protein
VRHKRRTLVENEGNQSKMGLSLEMLSEEARYPVVARYPIFQLNEIMTFILEHQVVHRHTACS